MTRTLLFTAVALAAASTISCYDVDSDEKLIRPGGFPGGIVYDDERLTAYDPNIAPRSWYAEEDERMFVQNGNGGRWYADDDNIEIEKVNVVLDDDSEEYNNISPKALNSEEDERMFVQNGNGGGSWYAEEDERMFVQNGNGGRWYADDDNIEIEKVNVVLDDDERLTAYDPNIAPRSWYAEEDERMFVQNGNGGRWYADDDNIEIEKVNVVLDDDEYSQIYRPTPTFPTKPFYHYYLNAAEEEDEQDINLEDLARIDRIPYNHLFHHHRAEAEEDQADEAIFTVA